MLLPPELIEPLRGLFTAVAYLAYVACVCMVARVLKKG